MPSKKSSKPTVPVSTVKPASKATRSFLADVFDTIADEEGSTSLKVAAGKLRSSDEDSA
jgi:hypothetical protein